MPTPFAYKLRLTAAALGCATRKELCERFRAVNPATTVDLERCHKWLQGVALPRSASVYDDWARLLGPEWSAAWIAASAPEAFAEMLYERFRADRADIMARAERFGRGKAQPDAKARSSADHRCGVFVAYSWAMSPRHAGRLIRGALTLEPGRRGRLAATYEEGIPGGPLRFTGAATASGRTLHVDLDAAGDSGLDRFFMVLLTRGRPLDALCGEFIGAPVEDSAPQPAASRIALLRIDAEAGPAAAGPDCYVPAETDALTADLTGVGFGDACAGGVAAAILELLGRPRPPLARTSIDDLAALAASRDACRPQLAPVMR